jgi:hypothetical protein
MEATSESITTGRIIAYLEKGLAFIERRQKVLRESLDAGFRGCDWPGFAISDGNNPAPAVIPAKVGIQSMGLHQCVRQYLR